MNTTPTPRTDSCEGSDGSQRECDDLADLARTLEREVVRLRSALSKSCDDEREMSISEGPGHSTCGLADELTIRAERAEREESRWKSLFQERDRLYLTALNDLSATRGGLRQTEIELASVAQNALEQMNARHAADQRATKSETELAKESARLDHLDKKLHIDLSRSSSEEDVYYVSFPKDRSKPTGPIFSEKHVPLRSAVDKAMGKS